MLKVIVFILLSLFVLFPLVAQERGFADNSELIFADGPENTDEVHGIDDIFEDDILEKDFPDDSVQEDSAGAPILDALLLKPMRFTLKHEISYKTEDPMGLKNNRSSFRLEYSKFFLKNYYLMFDYKITAFWSDDHRAEAENEDILFDTSSREAFLQAGFGSTSIKAGIQVLIWGISDGGAITDVISPRDYSELFFISLEESRIGQPMLTLDQFSSIGAWQLFFIPKPDFNKYPEEGTAYYYDPFDGLARYQDDPSDQALYEYGLRWKKTFGKSDVSLMAASLMANDYVYRMDGYPDAGKSLITKTRQRYSLLGMTANYAKGKFLYKCEIAYKMPKAFNDRDFQIVKKDVMDTSLAVEYSPGSGAYTLSLELVNNHVMDWEHDIQGAPRDANVLILNWNKRFFNDNFNVNWMTLYREPYDTYLHSLTTSYNWNDNLTLCLDAYYPDVKDEKSSYWAYRDQKQVIFRIQYQF